MNDIALSWDLFIVVFFVVVISYSFIVGLSRNLKILISSYVSILVADGFSEILRKYFFSQDPLIPIFKVENNENTFIIFKISIFVIFMVLFVIRGNFSINLRTKPTGFLGWASNASFGFLNAGIITATILRYVSGASFVDGTGEPANSALFSIYSQSKLVKLMIDNYNFWFSLPALVFITISLFMSSRDSGSEE